MVRVFSSRLLTTNISYGTPSRRQSFGETKNNQILLRSFLEAMASWLEDCDGYYGDQRDVGVADWQIFADALAAARIYE